MKKFTRFRQLLISTRAVFTALSALLLSATGGIAEISHGPTHRIIAASMPSAEVDPFYGTGAYVNAVLKDWDVPGAAVAVVTHEKLLFARGFGIKQLGTEAKIDEQTLFQIGSTSKAFTAAAIGVLVDEGVLNWDDPVKQHVPSFELSNPWLTRKVTIRDLLAHRSGLVDDIGYALRIFGEEDAMAQLHLIDSMVGFRREYKYSNFMYALAGQVIVEVSGMRWGDFLRQRIFNPLGMNSTRSSASEIWDPQFIAPTFAGTSPVAVVGIDNAPAHNVAMPHGRDRDGQRKVLPWQSYDSLAAGGNIVSSVSDMSRWLQMLMSGGVFEGRRILQESTVEELFAPQIAMPKNPFIFSDSTSSYTLGWMLTSFQGHRYLFHGGAIFGFPAYVALVPDAGVGVIVLMNGQAINHRYLPHQQITAWLLEQFLALAPRDWRAEAMEARDASIRNFRATEQALAVARYPGARPSLPLEAYAGVYTRDLAGPLRVQVENGSLELRFPGEGAFSGTLEHWHHDVFRLYWAGGDGGRLYQSSFVTFAVDDNGLAAALDAGILGKFERRLE